MKIIDMFNEDNTVEQMLIEAATQSGWQYVSHRIYLVVLILSLLNHGYWKLLLG